MTPTIALRKLLLAALTGAAIAASPLQAATLSEDIARDYDAHLGDLFDYFHRNPELSMMEHKTAERLASEIADAGFTVTTGVGGTGIVAMMENGPGPLVMMRADMDGLPVEEKSGLANASRAKQVDWDGNEVFVMHACGHDVHITSLVDRTYDGREKGPVVGHPDVDWTAGGRARGRRQGHDGG